jgi:hypothetical protein
MGYRVDNITDADRRVNQRLAVIAARGGDVEAFKARFMAGDREAIQRQIEVIEKYGAQIAREEGASV